MAEWKTFEDAVAAFLKALNPEALVRKDVLLPDLDTGLPRQRDVWIETSFGDHFNLTILVSCKRTKAKVSQQDMDAFIGEYRSSGANKGVLYSFSGFTKPALAKARRLGISCCTLYDNRPPDLPAVLSFSAYCLRERLQIRVFGAPEELMVGDLLALQMDDEGQIKRLLTALVERYSAEKARVIGTLGDNPTSPPTWFGALGVHPSGLVDPVTVRLDSGWSVYRAKLEYFLLNGSYAFTEQDFKGSFSIPWIDQSSTHPGPGWERLDDLEPIPSRNVVLMYSHDGDTEGLLREVFPPSAVGEAN